MSLGFVWINNLFVVYTTIVNHDKCLCISLAYISYFYSERYNKDTLILYMLQAIVISYIGELMKKTKTNL
jgi:hypothetical protein